jgi:hypothetical protein
MAVFPFVGLMITDPIWNQAQEAFQMEKYEQKERNAATGRH